MTFSFRHIILTAGLLAVLAGCTAFSPPKAQMPSRSGIVPGETITAKGNENVYGVAREYHVPMRDLIVLNDLQPPFIIRPGQKLVLPAAPGSGDMNPATIAPAPSAAASDAVESTTLPPIESASLPPVSKTPASGATQYTNTPKPAPGVGAPTPLTTPSAETLTTPAPVRVTPTTATPAAPAPAQQVASVNPSLAEPPAEAPSVSFIWPVQGPVLSAFGPKGQGVNNDGVNIGAPKGAPVVAAGSGIVIYAGNEMKGFGNLVLIRHSDGWVTAYAHLDRIVVSKDAVVAQGDMIGTVGKTGNVSSPQIHFETRYQNKPVNPNSVVKE